MPITSKVLLTGGTGFIGAGILDKLVKRGIPTVVTVRTEQKEQFIKRKYPDAAIEVVYVEDINVKGAFDDAVKDPKIEYVIHAASPLPDPSKDPIKSIVDPAVNGTTGILKSIKAFAPHVKHVVYTSSASALVNFPHPPIPGKVYTEESWNTLTVEDVKKAPAVAYATSKTLAERAFWDFVAQEEPSFAATAIVPPFVFGPPLQQIQASDVALSSNNLVYQVLHAAPDSGRPEGFVTVVADIDAVSEAHVQAIERPTVSTGKRWLVFEPQSLWHPQVVLDVLAESFPELKGKVSKGEPFTPEERAALKTYTYNCDNSVTNSEVKLNYLSDKEMVKQTLQAFIELDKQWGTSV